MDIAEFRRNEQAIYGKIRREGEEAVRDGLQPDPALRREIGGLSIVVRYPPDFAERLASLAHAVGELLPCVEYQARMIHSSLITCLEDNWRYQPERDEPRLRMLQAALLDFSEHDRQRWLRECQVDYGKPISSGRNVILPGSANDCYIGMLLDLSAKCQQLMPSAKTSWGSHVTIVRLKACRGPDKARELASLLGRYPSFGKVSPCEIEVGWCEATPESFTQSAFYRFRR